MVWAWLDRRNRYRDPMTYTLSPDRLDRISAWAQRYVDSGRLAGLSVLIRQHGAEVFYTQSGQRDRETGVPFKRDTVARIYSMTKPITSLILMMLVEEGRLHLDAPLSRFLPGFATPRALRPGATSIDDTAPCAVPTLHDLLTHRAGFSYPFNPGILPEAMAELDLIFAPGHASLAARCDALATLPLAFAPRARWEYSVSIDIIGRVIEVVTGAPLDAVFADRVLKPLNMTETGFTVPDSALARFATLYSPLQGDAMDLNVAAAADADLRVVDVAAQSPFRRTTCFSGGGGLVSTIDDYMVFVEALRSGGAGLVSPSTLRFMLSNHLPGDIASLGPASFAEQPMDGMGFGLGGAVVLDPARTRVPSSAGDFSWGGMASTFFWIDRQNDISTVLFTQLSPSSSTPARAELKALVHSALV